MKASDMIRQFHEFLEKNYHKELLEAIAKGEKSFVVDFFELSKFNPDLAETLIDYPEDVFKAAELAVEQFEVDSDLSGFCVRFKNLPESQYIKIRDIRSKDINKLLVIDGIVRQKSDVRPQVTAARFECPSCGNEITVLQVDMKFTEPSSCGCGRKGKFRLLSKDLVDAQKIVLEESPETLEGGEQAKRLNIFLKNDLVSPLSDKKTNPGTRIIVSGVVKEVPVLLRTGGQSIRFDLLMEANYVEPVEENFGEIDITPEEAEQLKELSENPRIYEKLVESIAPSIYGHEKVKEAILLQLMGGLRKVRDDGAVTRGDIHVLLIGDPGSGKSQLLKRSSVVAPKARYVSGKGASGAGLTAAVVRDEFLKGWALEAGALVLSNQGFVMIDELDKMTKEDRDAMHEALEQQTVSISKANIQATLRSEAAVLAAANPKFGRFDPYETIAKQIDLPSTLINRFDLIFPIRDLPDKDRDEDLAKFVLNLHQTDKTKETEISTELMRKYIAYARQNVRPKLTDSALEEIKNYYVKMRTSGATEEGGIKPIPISPRQLEALVRLSEASARTRLSDKVTKRDAKRAISLIHFCLHQVGIDPETGMVDIDRISTGIPATQRSKIATVREIINELEEKLGKIPIPIEEIVSSAVSKNIEEDDVNEIIEKLKRSGDIFEPKRGRIQKI
ncbi:AAA family ATPase [Candidatus Woesearchaeota archaeon]|nr:MAG: AAA family ATPase [Candidatus Woesearchaeota archaeon]